MPVSAKKRHFNSGLCMSCIHLGRGRIHTNGASEGNRCEASLQSSRAAAVYRDHSVRPRHARSR